MPVVLHQEIELESFMKLASKLYLAYTSADGFKKEGYLKGEIFATSKKDIQTLETELIDEMNRISGDIFYDQDHKKKARR
jgi:hypothetical protein